MNNFSNVYHTFVQSKNIPVIAQLVTILVLRKGYFLIVRSDLFLFQRLQLAFFFKDWFEKKINIEQNAEHSILVMNYIVQSSKLFNMMKPLYQKFSIIHWIRETFNKSNPKVIRWITHVSVIQVITSLMSFCRHVLLLSVPKHRFFFCHKQTAM